MYQVFFIEYYYMEDSSSSEDGAETDTTIEMDEKGNKLKL